MASPWICSTCRTRLPSIVRGARSVSQQAARRQGIGAVQEQYGGNEAVGGVGGNGNVRGRYSRREIQPEVLRPETVLHQLEEEGPAKERRVSGRRDGRIRPPEERSYARESDRNRGQSDRYPQQSDRYHGPPALIRDTDAFIDAVHQHNLPRAWSLLSDKIAPALHKIPFPPRRDWIRKALVQPRLHMFRHECAQEWLISLQNGTLSTHSLPSSYDIVSLIESLGFGKPVFYRPALWDLAAGINDLRLTHPNVDLQPGIEEVMKLWRLCHLVTITRARKGMNVYNALSDWSFLPPPTIFAASASRQDFNALLHTVVFVGKEDPQNLAKTDYTSPALVTLDLLRTTPCKTEDGSVGVYADSAEYGPWVKLMETLLKSAALKGVPPCIKRGVLEGSDELRERYWRLLRRVGMRQEVVEAEKLSPIYRRGAKEGVEAKKALEGTTEMATSTSTAQTSTSTRLQDDTALPVEEAKTPPSSEEKPLQTAQHIKFTTPPNNPIVERFALQQILHLGRALDNTDIHKAEQIRRSIAAFASSNNLTPTALPAEVYEHLMMVLFALKHPKSAVEVWRKFTDDGYVPSIKTYTVLMEGASHAHDVTTMEKFWNAMRYQAKLQPDAHAWSTRLKGLFLAKLPQKGLAALSEMGKEWYSAARNAEYLAAGLPLPQKGSKKPPALPEPSLNSLLSKYPEDVDGVPRPGLVVMNTAVAALASSYYDDQIPKVLHWGRTFQIEPDLITYNALLNICMRHSQGQEALSLLKRMREKGIEADSTTWTVLLTALFQSGFLDDLTHEAQGEKIMAFIRSLEDDSEAEEGKEKGGLDVKGYALIIDRLLKVHSNPNSAAEVLRYMVNEANLRPTSQIYTILMTSYFFPPGAAEGQGPDWAAIETLWTQISTPDQKGYTPSLDPIFFDRMVEGYALHHEIIGMRPAMDFLAKMSERGMKPGFGALEAVARMLAQRGEWDVLGRLVGEVRKRDPGRKGVVYQRQRGFWEFVVQTGILRHEGVETVEDVLQLGDRGRRGRGHWMD